MTEGWLGAVGAGYTIHPLLLLWTLCVSLCWVAVDRSEPGVDIVGKMVFGTFFGCALFAGACGLTHMSVLGAAQLLTFSTSLAIWNILVALLVVTTPPAMMYLGRKQRAARQDRRGVQPPSGK